LPAALHDVPVTDHDQEMDEMQAMLEAAGMLSWRPTPRAPSYRLTLKGAALGRHLAMHDDAGTAVLDALLDAVNGETLPK
jgi:hypothetical protein